MRNLFGQHSIEPKPVAALFPLALLAIIITLEALTPSVRVTPSLLMVGLALCALILPPRTVLIWTFILFAPFVLSLVYVRNAATVNPALYLTIRSLAFLTVGILAVAVSVYRRNIARDLNSLLSVFDSLHSPLIISDVDGTIRLVNHACCQLLNLPAETIRDSNYFSFFTDPAKRGHAIQTYISLFEGATEPESLVTTLVFRFNGEQRNYSAHIGLLVLGQQKLMLTQLVNKK